MMPATGYAIVYHLELALLFATLAVLGPLVTRPRKRHPTRHDSGGTEPRRFGLADFPG
jgi:BCD family chlorophyll transporter-like MFS transporter